MRVHAVELVGLVPDIILANSAPVLAAVQQKTHAIPIVFVQVADPIAGGFVASLARPGGNITGFTSFEEIISAKWLELIKHAAPKVTRVAIVRNETAASASKYFLGAIETAAPSLGVQLTMVNVRDAAEIERAFSAIGASVGGLGNRRALPCSSADEMNLVGRQHGGLDFRCGKYGASLRSFVGPAASAVHTLAHRATATTMAGRWSARDR
jgi:hypothetical protein